MTIVYFFIHAHLIAGKKVFLGSGEEVARLRGGGCPAPGRRLPGSGEEVARLRGGGCPAPGRKVLGSGEEVLFRGQAPEHLPGAFSFDFKQGKAL